VISASCEDSGRAYAVNFGIWPIEGPVERKEADGRVHTLDGVPQVFAMPAEVVVSGIP
jgi:hypothetical protein